LIKYLGSKRALLPRIVEAVAGAVAPGARVLDLFSGTARVGHALKGAGFRVHANDHNAYAHTLALCHVQADAERHAAAAAKVLADLARLPPRAGWFTATYAETARYLHPDNAARVEAIREAIAALAAEPELEAILLASLIQAADRVDSTAGVQMAYMKRWAPRALNALELRLPSLLPRPAAGGCTATLADAVDAARGFDGDAAYLDPPYNQHSYLGNYHVWETLVRWDAPATFGIAHKRTDVRERQSAFNSRRRIGPALAAVIDALRCPVVILSCSDEGWLGHEAIAAMLAPRFAVETIAIPHARYNGARIGIHNPAGERVGTVGRLTNMEYLLVATDRAAAPQRRCANIPAVALGAGGP
jgi:adenine-specific DNA-methyltransferase